MIRVRSTLFTLCALSALVTACLEEPKPTQHPSAADSAVASDGPIDHAGDDAAMHDAARVDRTEAHDAGPTDSGMSPDAGRVTKPVPEQDDAGSEPADHGKMDPPTVAVTSAAPGEIETVVVDVIYVTGAGGLLLPDFIPVILFKDGSACRDINFVVEGYDVATHKSKYPKSWTQWKAIDGKIALQTAPDRFTYLNYQLHYPPLSSDFVLDGKFMRLGGGGNTAFGGDVLIVTQAIFGFTPQRRFAQGSFAGVLSSSSTVTNAPPDQQGSYAIDGYRMTLHYDDGKTVTTSVVYTTADPGLLFMGGRSFTVDD